MRITLLILFAISTIITSCNTIEGLGKDIKAGGKNIEKSAK